VVICALGYAGAFAAAPSLAPGYGTLGYELPEAGSYHLPELGDAPDGTVLDTAGNALSLHQVFGNQYVLLGFIYSRCSDVNGCPLTSYVFYKLKSLMQKQPELARNLKLVSLSFDPDYDTPAIMRLYADNFRYAGNQGEWTFLTTRGKASLQPILDAYGQDIRPDSQSGEAENFSHILRVYLIDPQKKIRNIYSVAFLHADVVLHDLATLQQEALTQQQEAPTAADPVASGGVLGGVSDIAPVGASVGASVAASAGVSVGVSIESAAPGIRPTAPVNEFGPVAEPPLGLPDLSDSDRASLSPERIRLGRKLFFDRRLSLNNTFSCAMCHIPEQGFTSNELKTAVGIEGRTVRRNSPGLYNVGYLTRLFHDGREDSLEQQIWGPLLNRNEMGNPSVGVVLNKIRRLPDYDGWFETAFPGHGLTMITLGQALASYERTLVSGNSPFDRWYYGDAVSRAAPNVGDESVSDKTTADKKDANGHLAHEPGMSESAKRGFALFTGKAGCSGCHLIGEEWSLFTDNQLHNTGIGYARSMGLQKHAAGGFAATQGIGSADTRGIDAEKKGATTRVQLAPGVFVQVPQSTIDSVGESPPVDLGFYEITQQPEDRWKYRTPGLRNVALTAPYMHDGSLDSLAEVVHFYTLGGVPNDELDPRIHPLALSPEEESDLVDFLRALTGDNVAQLVQQARAAPPGDIGLQHPDDAIR